MKRLIISTTNVYTNQLQASVVFGGGGSCGGP